MENKIPKTPSDWEQVKATATRAIRDAKLNIVINQAVLECAEKQIKNETTA